MSFVKACVIGHPVGHSLSPVIHNYWIKKYGLEGQYDAREIPPEQFESGFNHLVEQGYTGFNVTLPYKQAVAALCDDLDDTAKRIGAVNTMRIDNGGLHGSNTDWFGFTESIREEAPDFDFRAAPALVLGAGGAARAVVYGLMREGAPDIYIANRTPEHAKALGRDFGARPVAWEDRQEAAESAGLLVNTTALGMKGQPPLIFDVESLPAPALVCDIVYNPRETELLRAARARGNVTVGGLGMLLHQARPAFRQWFGVMPEVTDELRELLEEKLK